MKNNHPFYSRFVQIAGFAPEVYQQCSTDQRFKMVMITGKLLFTTLASALIVSVALNYTIFHSLIGFFLTFCLFFGVNFFFDRMIISGQSSILTFLLRVIAILCIPILHTLLFDTYVFRNDLRDKYQDKMNADIALLKSDHQLDDAKDLDAIKAIEASNQDLNDTISLFKKNLAGEVDGTKGSGQKGKGEVFEAKKELFGGIISRCEQQIEANNDKIDKIEEERKMAKEELGLQKSKLTPWEEVGLLSRISLLHECTQENKWVLFFSILWWIFFVLLEALPMLGKGISKTKEYDECQAKVSNEQIRGFAENLKYKSELASLQLDAEFTNHRLKLHKSIKMDRFQAQMEEILALYQEEVNAMMQLAKEEEKIKQLVVEDYDQYILDAKLKAVRRLDKWIAEELRLAA